MWYKVRRFYQKAKSLLKVLSLLLSWKEKNFVLKSLTAIFILQRVDLNQILILP